MMQFKIVGQRGDGNIGSELIGQLGSAFQTAAGTYVGGQPVGIGPSGLIFGTELTAECCTFLGVFYNNSVVDTGNGGGVVSTTDLTVANPTVVYPNNKIGVFQGDSQSDESAPYENVDWGVGDDVFISPGGLWTNVSGDCTQSHGKVIVAPASYGDELVFNFSSYNAC